MLKPDKMNMEDLPLSDEDDDFSKESEVKRPRLLTQQERDRLEVEQYMQQRNKRHVACDSSRKTQALQLQLARQEQELAALRQRLDARAQEAAVAEAELVKAQQQVAALRCIVDESKQKALIDLVQQDVCRSYGLPGQRLLYHDVAAFHTLRQEAVYNRIEMLATAPSAVARDRLEELQVRELLDGDIETCLKLKKQAMEDRDTPPARVQDAVLQLFRLLHRRQTAVLQGYKLAPPGSLFAQVPK